MPVKPVSGAIPWQMDDYYYYAQGDDLRDLLRNFCQAQGINSVISEKVEGEASGFFQGIAPMDFLNQITKAYGLIWFYDGNILYIEPFDQIESRVLQTEYVEAVTILEVLDTLGIEGSNFSVRSLKNQGVTIISGAPRFVVMVEALIEKLETNEFARMGREGIEVFPLKHSWAYDLRFNYSTSNQSISTTASAAIDSNTDELIIPGVATLLKGLMDQKTENAFGFGLKRQAKMDTLGTRLEALKSRARINREERMAAEDYSLGSVNVDFSPSTMIEADKRLNAIVIKDVRSKMDMYRDLINALDQPVQVISISAAIVDVDKNYSRDLGTKFFKVNNKDGSWSGSISPDGSAKGVTQLTNGFNAQAQWPVSPLSFLSQVQALEKEGNANILSRPFLLTLDNVEAVLTKDETFFVKLEGKDDVDLANVTVGTTLKVIPHVIEEEDEARKIKLLVTVSDGEPIEDEVLKNVDGLPRTRKSTINTQAVIREGESLLIGGYFREAFRDANNGVPILRSIPVLGQLFQSKLKKNSTIERMFLITPRVVELSSDDTGGLEPDYDQYLNSWKKQKEAIEALKDGENTRDVLEGKSWHGGLLDSSSPAKKKKTAKRKKLAHLAEATAAPVATQVQDAPFLDERVSAPSEPVAVLQEEPVSSETEEYWQADDEPEADEAVAKVNQAPEPFVVHLENLGAPETQEQAVVPVELEAAHTNAFNTAPKIQVDPLKLTAETLSALSRPMHPKAEPKALVEAEVFESPDAWSQEIAVSEVEIPELTAPIVTTQRTSFVSDWSTPVGLEEEPELFEIEFDIPEETTIAEVGQLEGNVIEVFEVPEAWSEQESVSEALVAAVEKPEQLNFVAEPESYVTDVVFEPAGLEETPELFQVALDAPVFTPEPLVTPAVEQMLEQESSPQVEEVNQLDFTQIEAIETSALEEMGTLEPLAHIDFPEEVERQPEISLALSAVEEVREEPEAFVVLAELHKPQAQDAELLSSAPSLGSLNALAQLDAAKAAPQEEVTQEVLAAEEPQEEAPKMTVAIADPVETVAEELVAEDAFDLNSKDEGFEAFLAQKNEETTDLLKAPVDLMKEASAPASAQPAQAETTGNDFWANFDEMLTQVPIKKHTEVAQPEIIAQEESTEVEPVLAEEVAEPSIASVGGSLNEVLGVAKPQGDFLEQFKQIGEQLEAPAIKEESAELVRETVTEEPAAELLLDLTPEAPQEDSLAAVVLDAVEELEAPEISEPLVDLPATSELEANILAQLGNIHINPVEEVVAYLDEQIEEELPTAVEQAPAQIVEQPQIEVVEHLPAQENMQEETVPVVQEEVAEVKEVVVASTPAQEDPELTYPKASAAPKAIVGQDKLQRQERLERWKAIKAKRLAQQKAETQGAALAHSEEVNAVEDTLEAPVKSFEAPRGMTEAEEAQRQEKLARWRARRKESTQEEATPFTIADSFWNTEETLASNEPEVAPAAAEPIQKLTREQRLKKWRAAREARLQNTAQEVELADSFWREEGPSQEHKATVTARTLSPEEKLERKERIRQWRLAQQEKAEREHQEVELGDSFWDHNADTESVSHKAFVASKELAQDKKQRLRQWHAAHKKRRKAKALDTKRSSLNEEELLEQVSDSAGGVTESSVLTEMETLTPAEKEARMKQLMQWRKDWLNSL